MLVIKNMEEDQTTSPNTIFKYVSNQWTMPRPKSSKIYRHQPLFQYLHLLLRSCDSLKILQLGCSFSPSGLRTLKPVQVCTQKTTHLQPWAHQMAMGLSQQAKPFSSVVLQCSTPFHGLWEGMVISLSTARREAWVQLRDGHLSVGATHRCTHCENSPEHSLQSLESNTAAQLILTQALTFG